MLIAKLAGHHLLIGCILAQLGHAAGASTNPSIQPNQRLSQLELENKQLQKVLYEAFSITPETIGNQKVDLINQPVSGSFRKTLGDYLLVINSLRRAGFNITPESIKLGKVANVVQEKIHQQQQIQQQHAKLQGLVSSYGISLEDLETNSLDEVGKKLYASVESKTPLNELLTSLKYLISQAENLVNLVKQKDIDIEGRDSDLRDLNLKLEECERANTTAQREILIQIKEEVRKFNLELELRKRVEMRGHSSSERPAQEEYQDKHYEMELLNRLLNRFLTGSSLSTEKKIVSSVRSELLEQSSPIEAVGPLNIEGGLEPTLAPALIGFGLESGLAGRAGFNYGKKGTDKPKTLEQLRRELYDNCGRNLNILDEIVQKYTGLQELGMHGMKGIHKLGKDEHEALCKQMIENWWEKADKDAEGLSYYVLNECIKYIAPMKLKNVSHTQLSRVYGSNWSAEQIKAIGKEMIHDLNIHCFVGLEEGKDSQCKLLTSEQIAELAKTEHKYQQYQRKCCKRASNGSFIC